MTEPNTSSGASSPAHAASWRWSGFALLVLLMLLAGVLWGLQQHRERLQYRLLAADPYSVAGNRSLLDFAVQQAEPLYAHNCASCHGADLHGSTALGAPDLTDSVWLYGQGNVADIERTLLYGIRSGLSKTHNVAEMPAFGTTGALSPSEVRSVVQYVLKLSRRPYQLEAAAQGRALYFGRANCADCHSADGRGNPDYGAPDLTVNVWNSGSDPQSLFQAIYFGEHRVMPAWIGALSLEQIRALAVYVYSASHPEREPRP